MSHRKDRERAESGLLFRDGGLKPFALVAKGKPPRERILYCKKCGVKVPDQRVK